MPVPLVVGIGGSNRPGSVTERLLVHTLEIVSERGLRTSLFGGAALSRLAIYGSSSERDPASHELLEAVASADAVILASPGYHGGLSGLVKNAIDHFEELRDDPRPYLDGRAVGTIISAAGWQACGTALVSLRSTIHSLRGWPTPFGAMINSVEPYEDANGVLTDRAVGGLRLVAEQVAGFVERGRP